MANVAIPSPCDLRQLLDYDPTTGILTWTERSTDWFDETAGRTAKHSCSNWNSRYAGTRAFSSVDGHGYLIGAIRNKKYKAHRVIWAILNGTWPASDIDHVNGDRTDNRSVNLRQASRAENMRNRGATKPNTSGFKGVSWDSGRQKWLAQIKVDGRNRYLGRYLSPQVAHDAYVKAAADLHGDFAKTE